MYPAFEQALTANDSTTLLRLYTLAIQQRTVAEDRNRALILHITQLKAQSTDAQPQPTKVFSAAAPPGVSRVPAPTRKPKADSSEDLGI